MVNYVIISIRLCVNRDVSNSNLISFIYFLIIFDLLGYNLVDRLIFETYMQFVNPSFLWALLALAIPIIIHLFYFRRYKKVFFSNVKYLKEVKEEQSARKKLRNLLILLSRLAAVALLIIAFAQPFLPKGEKIDLGAKKVSIFIDNSFSMDAKQDDIPLLDKAKSKAREIVNAYGEADKIQILSHDLSAKNQRLVSKEAALLMIDNISISPAVQPLSKIVNRQLQLIKDDEKPGVSYLLSDFQNSITDIADIKDSSVQINLLPVQSVSENNISLDSVWLVNEVAMINDNNTLGIKLSNYGDSKAENIKLSLNYKGQTKPLGVLEIEAGESLEYKTDLKISSTGWQTATISLSDYPVSFDDKYFVAINVDEEINVLEIHQGGSDRYLKAAMDGLPYHILKSQNANNIEYNDLGKNRLILLNDLNSISSGLSSELAKYVTEGGNLMVFPGSSIDKSFNDFLSSLGTDNLDSKVDLKKEVAKINKETFVFNKVFLSNLAALKLPATTQSYPISNYQNRAREKLITYRDGSSYLNKYNVGAGNVFLMNSSLSKEVNDLVLNAEIFIPLLYKSSLSKQTTDDLAYKIGTNKLVKLNAIENSAESTFSIKGAENEFIPGQLTNRNQTVLDVNDQITKAGVYDVNFKDKLVKKVAFNYDRLESNLKYANLDLITKSNSNFKLLETENDVNLASLIDQKSRGVVLWRWCLIFALVFLALESLLVRFWKT